MSHVRAKAKAYKVKTENKGVTATGTDINDSLSLKRNDGQKHRSPRNLQTVREELRNVIELMGPNSPHLVLNSSSEADNEESYITETSFYSSVVQVKHVANTKTDESRPSCDTPRDISQISALPPDSEVHNVDVDENKYVPMYVDPRLHYLSCPCREYARHLQQFQSLPGMNTFKTKENYTIRKDEEHNDKFGSKFRALNIFSFFKSKRVSKEREPIDLYKINILQPKDEHSPPARLVFDRVEDIPKPDMNTVATNTSLQEKSSPVIREIPGIPGVPTPFHSYIAPPKFPTQHRHQYVQAKEKNKRFKNTTTKFDVYYFDHGDSAYFKTTDCSPALFTEMLAEKTEAYTSRFWAETFGTIHIGFSFFTSFILQLLRFVLQSLIRPLTVGFTQLTSDYCFKPCLAVIFNGIIQPPLIFFYNIATSLRDLFDPIAEGIGYFLRELANVFRSVRLIEVNSGKQKLSQALHSKKKPKLKRGVRRIV
ncbi:hypothetical protein Trydic_g20025 [Trypoxylus dichotomus]